MAGNSMISVRVGVLAVLAFASLQVPAALAEDCPGHPDAIGTSRTIVVDPTAHPRIGTMQYPETLPLRDHEVVLTFDDGPIPKNSNQVLQTLADNCAKATFFIIGEQARAFPDGVRKYVAAGHTIGTHSQTHPLTFEKMPMDKVQKQVDDGIASVTAALSDPAALSPFFRVPGLLRGANVEQYAASKGLQIWSADFLADDWRHISSAKVYELAIKRLEAKHKGILLLHDIQARTAAALPKILHEMKVRGYHIVQVVAATPDRPATPTEPQDWRMRAAPETLPVAERPKFPTFVLAEAEQLVTPVASDFSTPDGKLLLSGEPFERVRRPMQNAPAALWPAPVTESVGNAAATLPAPAETVFAMPETTQPPVQAEAAKAGEPPAASESAAPAPRRIAAGKAIHGRGAHVQRHAAHAGRAETKQQAETDTGAKPAPRRQVKVASLKKREK
ncbi:MAG TPA: polysaccharide deacetylase family protein [Bradyrhizobium sp.]|nr:polysaccharide deacetylase family protein [Bradyrhizobium sp.]